MKLALELAFTFVRYCFYALLLAVLITFVLNTPELSTVELKRAFIGGSCYSMLVLLFVIFVFRLITKYIKFK